MSARISLRSRQLSGRASRGQRDRQRRSVPKRWISGACCPSLGSGEVRDRDVVCDRDAEWVPLPLERRVVVAMGASMGAPDGLRGSVAARPRSRG